MNEPKPFATRKCRSCNCKDYCQLEADANSNREHEHTMTFAVDRESGTWKNGNVSYAAILRPRTQALARRNLQSQ